MRPTIRHAVLLAVSLTVLACSSGRIENPWLNPRPPELLNERWQEVPHARYREVTADARAHAVRMLTSDAVQRLPGRDVHRFVPGDFSNQPAGRFYLLRAVTTSGQNGSYQILIRGRAVTVRYSAVGAGNAAAQSAVVADLEAAPERVFVELTVAQ